MVLWWTFWKWLTGRNFSMSGHHYLQNVPTYQILMISDNVEFLLPIFYAVFWQLFWKMADILKRRIAPLMVTYHYVKFYVSIIIHLEVISQCWIFAVLWRPFWKWWPVEIFQCRESIRDIIIYPHMTCRWNRTMLNLFGIVVAISKMATGRNFPMSEINPGHH